MRKIYKELTEEQKARNVVFSSCLSEHRTEQTDNRIHEVMKDDEDRNRHISLLINDKFFNGSPWKYNIIRE